LLLNPTDAAAGPPAIPLAMLGPGQSGVVVNVHGGRGIRRRLSDMGLVPGNQITVMNGAGAGGPLIIAVLETRLMLGRGMAHKILVQPL